MTDHIKQHPVTLYHYWRSSCSWRVRWALNLKEISYKKVSINLKEGEHHQHNWQQQHPSGFVPQLHWGPHILSQSLAIIEWLDEMIATPSLLPSSSIERQRVRQLSQIIACDTQPIQNLRLLQEQTNKEQYAQKWIRKGLTTFQHHLTSQDDFCFGSQITLADLCLIPQWYNAIRFGIRDEEFPQLAMIYQRCLNTDACFQASPEQQT